jgi:hypothetical protein
MQGVQGLGDLVEPESYTFPHLHGRGAMVDSGQGQLH